MWSYPVTKPRVNSPNIGTSGNSSLRDGVTGIYRWDSPNSWEEKLSGPNRYADLNIYYQNAWSIRNKSGELFASCTLDDYHVIDVSETWLSENHFSGEYFPETYAVLRSDRKFDVVGGDHEGGVLLALDCNIGIITGCQFNSDGLKHSKLQQLSQFSGKLIYPYPLFDS